MNKRLYQIALEACKQAYRQNTDLGTTEYIIFETNYKDKRLQVISIAGTNEGWDWFKNINIRGVDGIKKSGVDAAKEIHQDIMEKGLFKNMPLLLTSHSKGTAACVAFKKLYGAKYCVLFNPVRCMSRQRDNAMEGTTIFIDKEDIVSKLACLSFRLPKCKVIKKPDDGLHWWNLRNHDLSSWDDVVG